MQHTHLLKAALLGAALLLVSCAEKKIQQPPPCNDYWTIAPENLIVELAAGNEVIINPAYADFPLFCGASMAKQAFAGKKGWAAFRLADTDCVEMKEDRLYLSRPASLITWEKLP